MDTHLNGFDLVFQTDDQYSHFFGYYYNNPLDTKAEKLLAHRTAFEGRELQAGDCAEIGYYTLADGQWHPVGKTEAFNWQDGAMLQWVPGKEGIELVYNLLVDGVARARVVNLESGAERLLEKPIYAMHPSGKWAIGVNFSRLAICRPSYGYREAPEAIAHWEGNVHPEDGLFKVDLETGKSSLLVQTSIVSDFGSDLGGEAQDALHYLHHPIWNLSGSRFMFLHRYLLKDGSFPTRLFTTSSDGSSLYQFTGARSFSHATWLDDLHICIWCSLQGGVGQKYTNLSKRNPLWLKILRPILRYARRKLASPKVMQQVARSGYYCFKDQSTDSYGIGLGQLLTDGHPTFFNNGTMLLTDTYEDAANYRHLMEFNLESKEKIDLGKFYSPFNSCGYRCDLHPRTDPTGKFICIDSAHQGKRQIYVFSRN